MNFSHSLGQHLPEQMRAALRFYYTEAKLLRASVRDRIRHLAAGEIPLPPVRLRFRVDGAMQAEHFLAAGRNCARDLHSSLAHVGREMSGFVKILDFGCGCGRTLRHLRPGPEQRFFGVDIDPDAIRWCRSAISYADFRTNSISPPLPFPDAEFDFIYGISVLTHLDEGPQLAWLSELRRVVRPGGTVVLTVLGAFDGNTLSEAEIATLRARGFLFKTFRTGKYKVDGLPDFYQSTFHREEYVYRTWSNYLHIRAYLPRAMNGHHDAVVLER